MRLLCFQLLLVQQCEEASFDACVRHDGKEWKKGMPENGVTGHKFYRHEREKERERGE